MALFFAVRRHYGAVAEQIGHPRPLDLSHNDLPVAVVPLGGWNIVSERALRFGIRLSPDVYAVYVKLPDASGNDDEGEPAAAGRPAYRGHQHPLVHAVRPSGANGQAAGGNGLTTKKPLTFSGSAPIIVYIPPGGYTDSVKSFLMCSRKEPHGRRQ